MEQNDIPKTFLILTDEEDIKRAVKGSDVLAALWDFDQWLRNEYKYQGNEAAAPIRARLHETFNDYSVSFEDLYV